MKEIGRELIRENGCLKTYKVWREGHSHWEGQNIQGWTGDENVITERVLEPYKTFNVIEKL